MRHLALTKQYWKRHLAPADLCIDATCGNGHDTLFLAELCTVIGIDIQEIAIHNTKQRLALSGKMADLYRMDHSQIDQLTLPMRPSLIVYNLGYLPGSDKLKTTLESTTLISIQKSTQLITSEGAISITCYPGHPEGAREEQAILKWASSLDYKEWNVCYHQWLNREKAPSVIWLEKASKR